MRLPPASFAGLKATLACSAVFVSGRPLDSVLVEELSGMPTASDTVATPVVDQKTRSVSVSFSPDRTPRTAAYREGRGCTILPEGSDGTRADIPNPRPERTFGQDDWPAQEVAAGDELLAAVLGAAFDGATYGKGTSTIGVVVVQRGDLVGERYAEGFGPRTPYRMWSSAKMLANALTGVLVRRGELTLDDPAPIPEWSAADDPRSRITVRNLLNMSSGLDPKGSGSYAVYHDGVGLAADAAPTRLVAKPGTKWNYANRDTLLLSHSMRAALGDEEYRRFPYAEVVDRIGMRDTILETDLLGNYIVSSQVYSTPRDMARLGLLFLDDGVWRGERILPEGWVALSTTPAPARPHGIPAIFTYGVRGFVGYGAQVWLYRKTPLIFRHAAFSAIGHRGQYITVVPSHDLVVVRTGLDPEEGDGFWRQDRFVAAVADALAKQGSNLR